MDSDETDRSRSLNDAHQISGSMNKRNDESSLNNTREQNPSSPPSPFLMNPEPIREDQVDNAVKFLSHPKVRGSPVIHRRSFLEKKGLTKEEIDESFRRVPDPSPSLSSDQTAENHPQQSNRKPSTAVSSAPVRSKFQWYYLFLSLGALAGLGVGTALILKHRLKSWIRKITLEGEREKKEQPGLTEEAVTAAREAAVAAACLARANLEILNSKNEDGKKFEDRIAALDAKINEVISLHVFKATPTTADRSGGNAVPSPNHLSYTEVVAAIQRGEVPANVRDVDDAPPDPLQPLTNSRFLPRSKPWELEGEYGSGVRITEIEGEAEAGIVPYPTQRAWVPPKAPSISMPEAALAIRQAKASSMNGDVLAAELDVNGGDSTTA